MVDLTSCPVFTNIFGGSEKKMHVKYNNRFYMVKFPDRVREAKNSLSYMNAKFIRHWGLRLKTLFWLHIKCRQGKKKWLLLVKILRRTEAGW